MKFFFQQNSKKRLTLLVISSILCLILLFFSPSLINAFAKASMSNVDYYQKIEKDNFNKDVNKLTKAYMSYLKRYQNTKNGIGSSVTFQAKFNSKLANDMDLKGLKSLNASMLTMTKGLNSKISTSISVNNKDLTSFDLYEDNKNEIMYLLIPELSDAFLKITSDMNLDESLTDDLSDELSGDLSENVTNDILDSATIISNLESLLNSNLLTEDLLKELLTRYYSIIIEQFDNVTLKSNSTVKIDGTSDVYDKYTVSLDKKTILAIANKILETARTDEDLIKLVEASKFYTKDEFINKIDSLKKSISSNKEKFDAIKMSVYVDKNGSITGRELLQGTGDDAFSLGYKTVKKGTSLKLKAWLGMNEDSGLVVLGNAKVGLNGVTGTAKLSLAEDGIDFMSLNVAFDNIKYSKENDNPFLNGKITLSSELLGNKKFIVSFTGNSDEQKAKSYYVAGSKILFQFTTTAKVVPFVEFNLPSTNDKVYDYNKELDAFLSKENLEKYLNELKKRSDVKGIDDLIDSLLSDDSYM